MNSQFFPGANESLNKEAHQKLLSAASHTRRISKTAVPHRLEIGPSVRQPRLLEPFLSAVLTAAIAVQVALLVGF